MARMRSLSLSILALLAASCASSRPESPAPRPRLVLTTFQPTYSFASWVAAGSTVYEVANLAPPAQGPHEFVIDAPACAGRCRELLKRADAVVTLRGLPVAPAFARVYPWCRREKIGIVEIDPSVTWDAETPKLALIPNPEDSAKAVPAGLSEGARNPNPHVWLSLSHAGRMVEAIARDLISLDPANAALYRGNADRAEQKLRLLKAEFEGKLVDAPPVAALTEGFPYLCSDFGIDVADYILEPRGPAQVTARIKAAGVRVVLAEEPPEKAIQDAVAAAGARVVVLTTLEQGWMGKLEPDGYLEGMRSNLCQLVEAFRVK
jgi:ABC-type Zn uptake system ZnuABC Zn-binding protein ZnuA